MIGLAGRQRPLRGPRRTPGEIAGGVLVFGDPLATGPLGIVLQATAFALVCASALLLPREKTVYMPIDNDPRLLEGAAAVCMRLGNDFLQVVKVVEQEPRALGIAQLGLVKEHQLAELTTDQAIEQELSLVTLGEPTAAQHAVIKAVRQVAASLDAPAR